VPVFEPATKCFQSVSNLVRKNNSEKIIRQKKLRAV
jgi:hypothetical protein